MVLIAAIVAAGLSALTFVFMFLPWIPESFDFEDSRGSQDGWEALHRTDIVIAVGAGIALALLVAVIVLAALRIGPLAIRILAALAFVGITIAALAVFVIFIETDGFDISAGMVLALASCTGGSLAAYVAAAPNTVLRTS